MNTHGNNNIYDIPFDQFQRYQTTKLIIEKVRKESKSLKILEIGANEHKNLEVFLPNDNIKYLDIQLSDKLTNDPQYILADATNMPEIETNSFDVVIALDVFEHIPKELRNNFLNELNRVSENLVILAGPYDENGVNETEIRVNSYFKTKFGIDYIWLDEHIKNGLPNLNDTLKHFQSIHLKEIIHFKHGKLKLWEELIRLHFEVADSVILQEYRQNIDKFYNQNIFYSDISEDCYRDFIILSENKIDMSFFSNSEDKDSSNLDVLSDLINSAYRLSNEKRIGNIQEKDKVIQDKDKAIQEKDKAIQEKDKAIQEKDKAIQEKDIHIQNLHIIIESLRLKNIAKRLIKKVVPEKILKIARYIKHNPSSIKLGLHTLKSQGASALYRKIKKVNYLSESRIVNDYIYNELEFTEVVKEEINNFKINPLVSIIMPVYNVDPKWLELAIKSIEKQWYQNWEICIADDKSTNIKTINYLKSLNNAKIKIKYLDKNLNISGSSNAALELAEGEYLLLMDNDDEITPDALYEVVKVINENNVDFIYSDEDKMEMNGTFCEPHFKPDFAPDMFLSQNYISHLCVIKKELIDKVNGFTIGLEGAQDYDLYLKVLEHTDKIYHIPKVLYHWRKIPGSTAAEFGEKSYAQESGRKSIENAMKRRNIDVIVENGKYPGTYKVNYILKELPLVSIIIPFKDKPELLDMCINSVLDKSTYKNYEIIGISNNSIEESTFIEMKKLEAKSEKVKFYEYNVPFNYSMINNYAVNTYAKGEHIILLNNDIEIITCEWIEEMLMFSQREDIGCVGAKLYYPNDTIQHAGVVIGIGGIAGHSHKYFHRNNPGYISRLNLIQNFSAVTAACLMVKKSIYNQVEGLNEKDLKIAFNDVDFCLRVQEKSYKNIFTPYCEAYHHESISRGAEDNLEKITRFNSEVDFMKLRHKDILKNGDPYYNVNLTLDREDFGL